MDEKNIRRLRRRFIASSMLALFSVMLIMSTFIYLANRFSNINTIHLILGYIVENDGDLIVDSAKLEADKLPACEDELYIFNYDFLEYLNEFFDVQKDPKVNIQVFGYNTPYFTAILKDDKIVELKNQSSRLSDKRACDYAMKAYMNKETFARDGVFYYLKKYRDDGSVIIAFLDSSSQIYSNHRLMYSVLSLTGFFVIVTFILVYILSYKAIQPEIKNIVTQKRFITNASHELKTPLAVIRANTEMQEILNGESEWTQSTLNQVDRLNGLIQNLVMITRAQEKEEGIERVEVNVSELVSETCKAYLPVATQSDKTMEFNIPDNIVMIANDVQIRQLTTLLLDNAVKYCDVNGLITAALSKKGKGIQLVVSNSFKDGKNVDYSKFFERFYRQDEAHSIDKEGYGIGLSIAESLVEQYNGSIGASWKNGTVSFVCVLR